MHADCSYGAVMSLGFPCVCAVSVVSVSVLLPLAAEPLYTHADSSVPCGLLGVLGCILIGIITADLHMPPHSHLTTTRLLTAWP
jgi:hypothetical protein